MALPLVTSILHSGIDGVRRDLDQHVTVVREFHAFLKGIDEVRLLHEPDLAILCFQYVPNGFPEDRVDELQDFVYRDVMRRGDWSLSRTVIAGRTAIRFLILAKSVTLDSMKSNLATIVVEVCLDRVAF